MSRSSGRHTQLIFRKKSVPPQLQTLHLIKTQGVSGHALSSVGGHCDSAQLKLSEVNLVQELQGADSHLEVF